MAHSPTALAVVVACLCSSEALAAQASFTDLGMIPGGVDARPRGASADCSVIVGQTSTPEMNRNFMWTRDSGMQLLPGSLIGDEARAISADGTTVVGGGFRIVNGVRTTIPMIATCVNGDGSVIAGISYNGNHAVATRWTETTGPIQLGMLPPDGEPNPYSYAAAISRDGNVVAGGSQARAFRWNQSDGIRNLGALNSDGEPARAFAAVMTPDGAYIAGDYNFYPVWQEVFVWSEGAGTEHLGSFNGSHLAVRAISADGNTVVGMDNRVEPPAPIIWRRGSNWMWLKDYLLVNGLDIGSRVLWDVTAISDDAMSFVGTWREQAWGGDYRAFVATLPSPAVAGLSLPVLGFVARRRRR